MTKVAILGDTHFGARNGNKALQAHQAVFFTKQFWPYVAKHGITDVIQTGDLFDDRKALRHEDIQFCHDYFLNPARWLKVKTHIIVGNHDVPHKTDLKDSAQEVLGIPAYRQIADANIGGRSVRFCPWICDENYEEILHWIERGGDVLIGHFGINEFEMQLGAKCNDGLNSELFSGWKHVLSGHFHHQSKKLNIQYVGTPYQMSWADYESQHGFWVWDTVEDTFDFIVNNSRLFVKYTWREDLLKADLEPFKDKWVRLEVKDKPDVKAFERFVHMVNSQEPADLKIIEQFEQYHSESVTDMLELAETEQLMDQYIDDVATDDDKAAIKALMRDIYAEAKTRDA